MIVRSAGKYGQALYAILAGVLACAVEPAASETTRTSGPLFRADGPDADIFGQKQGYPRCTGLAYIGDFSCRVGALSHFDALFPARVIRAPASPTPLRRAASEPSLRYEFSGETRTVDDYLDRHPVTGFLIARGDTILLERYQYARTDKHRLSSFSMAKSVIGLLIGIALEEGTIRSIEDTADSYVPRLRGTEFGRTPIKALLTMTSGVLFNENYRDVSSDAYTLMHLALFQDAGGSLAALKRFNKRFAAPGVRYSYSSADSLVLGLVLSGATRRTVADYAAEKLWVPLGAEADATWSIDAAGQEITFAFMNAVLRDWARLGLMLAHEGAWQGRQIVPRQWLRDATTIAPGSLFWSSSMQPGGHGPGYGYQVWLLPTKHRTFALRGFRGQYVLVDPEHKIVLVQTALEDGSESDLFALWATLPAQLR